MAQRGEEGLEAEVVVLQDGVELVVMAAGAADGEAEEDLAGEVGDLVEDVGPLAGHVALVELVGAVPVVGGGDLHAWGRRGRVRRRRAVR